jgi:FYVE zinc finger
MLCTCACVQLKRYLTMVCYAANMDRVLDILHTDQALIELLLTANLFQIPSLVTYCSAYIRDTLWHSRSMGDARRALRAQNDLYVVNASDTPADVDPTIGTSPSSSSSSSCTSTTTTTTTSSTTTTTSPPSSSKQVSARVAVDLSSSTLSSAASSAALDTEGTLPTPEEMPSDLAHLLHMPRRLCRPVPDDAVTSCYYCPVVFTTYNRRHHCRVCGRIVCAKCSGTTVKLPLEYTVRESGEPDADRFVEWLANGKPITPSVTDCRVCDLCHNVVARQQRLCVYTHAFLLLNLDVCMRLV